MVIKVCGLSDIGKRREINEDSYGIVGFENGDTKGVCVLADGMGGHNAGEVASSIVVECIIGEMEEALSETDEKVISNNIAAAIDYANATVYERSLKNREQAGMGTTLVVSYVFGNQVIIANIGDSRAYVVSDKEISRITVDHSVVEELVQRGAISRSEAKVHPDKNIITRAVGTDAYVDADFYDYTASEGETIILCSDGLTEMVDEEKIQALITENESVENAVTALVEEANNNGGVDNITVVAFRFEKEDNSDDADR